MRHIKKHYGNNMQFTRRGNRRRSTARSCIRISTGTGSRAIKTQELNVAEAKNINLFIKACERYGFQSREGHTARNP